MLRKFLVIILIFTIITQSAIANMAPIFNDCTFLDGTTTSNADNTSTTTTQNTNQVISGGVISDVYNSCKTQCNSYSQLDPQLKNELNADKILGCRMACQESFVTGSIKQYVALPLSVPPSSDSTETYSYLGQPIATPQQSTSTQQSTINNNYLSVPISGDNITIVTLDTTQTNTIYACGHKIVELNPAYPNMFNMSPQNVFGGNTQQLIQQPQSSITSIQSVLNTYGGYTSFNFNDFLKTYSPKASLEAQLNNAINKSGLTQNQISEISEAENICNNDTQDQLIQCFKQYMPHISDAQIISAVNIVQLQNQLDNTPGNSFQDDGKWMTVYNAIKNNTIYSSDLNFKNTYPGVSYGGPYLPLRLQQRKTMQQEWNAVNMQYHPCWGYLANPGGINNNDAICTGGNPFSSCAIYKNFSTTISNINKTLASDPTTLLNTLHQGNCFPDWHIYNPSYTDTGITVNNGDYLKISWSGDLVLGNGLTVPFFNKAIAKIANAQGAFLYPNSPFSNFTQSNAANAVNANAKTVLREMSGLDFSGLNTIFGEDDAIPTNSGASQQPTLCSGKNMSDITNTHAPWYGLSGTINRNAAMPNLAAGGINITNGISCPTTPADVANYCNALTSNTGSIPIQQSPPCGMVDLAPDNYKFEGILNDLSQATQLKIRHYYPQQSSPNYSLFMNSIISGGHNVSIEWGGCPMTNGQGLQYAFGNAGQDQSILAWTDITVNNNSSVTFIPSTLSNTQNVTIINPIKFDDTKFNTVFFRVKPQGSGDFSLADGSYGLIIQNKANINNDGGNILKSIADSIYEVLITGPNYQNGNEYKGAIVNLSQAIAHNFSHLIQIILVLYMMSIGLGFMMGTIQISQKEAVNRTLKITFICILLSPPALAIFNQMFIGFFIFGSIKMASYCHDIFFMIMNPDTPVNVNTNDVFNMFDYTIDIIKYIFHPTVGYRLLALIMSNILGICLVIVIVVSVIKTVVLVIDAGFIIISTMIAQCFMLLIAPICIPFKLFKMTENIFDQWFKFIISYTLIPVALSVTLTFFFLLIKMAIEAALSFSYCWQCWFNIDFGLGSLCFIKMPYLLSTMFIPGSGPNFFMPTGIIAGTLILVLITIAAEKFITFAPHMISMILTFKPENKGEGSMTGVMGAAVQSITGSHKGEGGFKDNLSAIKNTIFDERNEDSSRKNRDDGALGGVINRIRDIRTNSAAREGLKNVKKELDKL